MRPSTLAETAERVASGQSLDRALPEFLDAFYLAATPERQISMLTDEPQPMADPRVDGLFGAVAEYLAHQFNLPLVPAWARTSSTGCRHCIIVGRGWSGRSWRARPRSG